MTSFRQQLGLLRSILIYYGTPFRKKRLSRFYGQFIQPNELCFDIGAHVGNRIQVWAGLGARVVALEPQPHCMRLLRRWYGKHPHVTLLEEAVGATSGTQSLFISQRNPTVSTLSQEWIETVQERDVSFAHVEWDETIPVTMTTLDALIAQYGQPVFCKIDVEGYELSVLEGLSQPIQALSFEYIPATTDASLACLSRLAELAPYEFNWSRSESHHFQSPTWLTSTQMADVLQDMTVDSGSGDIYARRSAS